MSGWRGSVYPLLAAALGVVGLAQLLAEPPAGRLAPAVLASALAIGALALIPGRLVLAAAGVIAGVGVLAALLTTPPFATFLACMVLCAALARYGSAREAFACYGALAVTIGAMAFQQIHSGADSALGLVYPVVYFGGAALVGWLARQRAANLRLTRERADALEREQATAKALAAAEERARLARDLHDVISHGISLMVVQAEAAAEILPRDPERAAQAVEAVADTGRAATADLHTMLSMLGPGPARLTVSDLVDGVRRLGVDVRVTETGEARPLPPAVADTARRIVQEALTNAVRHGAPGEIALRTEYAEDELVIEVVDDGTARLPPVPGSGRGLRGMVERADLVGGSVTAGPAPEGGFRVRARLRT
ncbi:UNVERIFIED_ORG: signal transduction histidine kinase [Microbispora rosea subsp. rosea]